MTLKIYARENHPHGCFQSRSRGRAFRAILITRIALAHEIGRVALARRRVIAQALCFRTPSRRRFTGDRLAGLIETCRLNGVAAFEYLLALVRNADEVRAAPSAWLPWTYPRQSAKATAA